MNKRTLLNVLSLVVGVICIILAFTPSSVMEAVSLSIVGAVCIYVAISGLRIKP